MKSPAAIILDFDGVMAQTSEMKLELLLTVARECQVSCLSELADALTGCLAGSDRFSVGAWIAERDESVTMTHFASRYTRAVAGRMPTAEIGGGLSEFMLRSTQEGVPVAVVSLAPADEIRSWLSEVGIDQRLFVSIRGVESGDKLTNTRTAVSELGVVPSQVISIGDSPADFNVASLLGLDFIRIRSAAGDRFDWQCQPALAANSLADLIRHKGWHPYATHAIRPHQPAAENEELRTFAVGCELVS
jgi:phosphoglycolate phosphatase-like HAD superfamily hydrolase